MESNAIRTLIAVVLLAGAGLVPALAVYYMVRPLQKSGRLRSLGAMHMNVRGLQLDRQRAERHGGLGSFSGRW